LFAVPDNQWRDKQKAAPSPEAAIVMSAIHHAQRFTTQQLTELRLT
jgi:hypothetical protein